VQLLRLFRLDEFPNFTKPVDPSLYIHRFVERLKLGSKKAVSAQAKCATAQTLTRCAARVHTLCRALGWL